MSGQPKEEPTTYAVRLSGDAARRIEEEWDRLDDLLGEEAADTWRVGIRDTIASLATFPGRCVIASEDRLFPGETLRQLIYQRRRGGPTWRILFSIRPANANDPPTVRVHLIQHGSQTPLTEWPADDDI